MKIRRLLMGRDLTRALNNHLAACERMAQQWAEADPRVRGQLWRGVHTSAERLREDLGR